MNMHSASRTRYIRITVTAIAVSIVMVRSAHTDELENKQKALQLISNAADSICTRIPLEGHGTDIKLSGEAKAQLSNALKQIADLGISGSADYNTSDYQGVLHHELASSIQKSDDCRLSVFDKLSDKLLPPSDRR